MKKEKRKTLRHKRRRVRVRKRISGTAETPRLSVRRTLEHIYAQVVDDDKGVTICEASTRSKDLRGSIKYGGNIAAAEIVGTALAERAKAKGIESVRFDRNGYKYHGRVKSLAEAARKGGLVF